MSRSVAKMKINVKHPQKREDNRPARLGLLFFQTIKPPAQPDKSSNRAWNQPVAMPTDDQPSFGSSPIEPLRQSVSAN